MCGIACFGALFARLFMLHFIGRQFEPAIRLVPWIVGAYLMHSLFAMFQLAAIQACRTKTILAASFLALALNTILNFALIPSLGMYGAAYATFLAYVVEAVVMYVVAQRVYHLHYELPRIGAALAVFGVALVVTQIPWSATMGPMVTGGAAILCFGLLTALGRTMTPRRVRQIS
jgi:O-antigen/teichoic acid export membrane protein